LKFGVCEIFNHLGYSVHVKEVIEEREDLKAYWEYSDTDRRHFVHVTHKFELRLFTTLPGSLEAGTRKQDIKLWSLHFLHDKARIDRSS
jgi:hypothetical protein